MKKSILSIFKKNRVVSIYIGRNTVDLVVLEGALRSPKLLKFGQTFIVPKEESAKEEIILEQPTGSKVNQDVTQKNEVKKTRDDYLVEAIHRLLKENNVKPCNVVSAIPSEEAMVRYFQMPKIPKQEWTSAINFEAKRYIPFRMEDVASDFQVIQSQTASNSMDVVFIAVKQKTIEQHVKLLELAGVKPVIVEPAPFSLIRAFNAAEQINNKVNTAIVYIGEASATIIILKTGLPYIIRDIPMEEGITGDKYSGPIFEKLMNEIRLSFDFYEKQFPSEVIDKIIIYSYVELENWHELVGKELQIPVEVGDPLRGIRIKQGLVPPRMAIAFGLALRGISESFLDLNLCRERMLVYKRKEIFLKMLFLEATAAVFLLMMLKLISMKQLAPLADKLEETLSGRPKLEVNIKDYSISALERTKNEMEVKKALLENIMSNRTYFTSRLMGLVKSVPENIWLSEVSFEEKMDKKNALGFFRQFTIKGYCILEENASEGDIINNFFMDLKEANEVKAGFKKSDIVSVKKIEMRGERVASFEIVFTGP